MHTAGTRTCDWLAAAGRLRGEPRSGWYGCLGPSVKERPEGRQWRFTLFTLPLLGCREVPKVVRSQLSGSYYFLSLEGVGLSVARCAPRRPTPRPKGKRMKDNTSSTLGPGAGPRASTDRGGKGSDAHTTHTHARTQAHHLAHRTCISRLGLPAPFSRPGFRGRVPCPGTHVLLETGSVGVIGNDRYCSR